MIKSTITFFKKRLICLLPDEQYGKGAIRLILSTIASQSLAGIALPLLTRIYQPEQFGEMGLFVMFLSIASVILAMRYEASIVAAKNKLDAVTLLFLSSLFGFLLAIFFSYVFYELIEHNLFGLGALNQSTSIMMLIALISLAFYQPLRFFFLRDNEYKMVSSANTIQNLAKIIAQLILGVLHLEQVGLIIGEMFGRLSGVGRMLFSIPARMRFYLKRITFDDIKRLMFENKNFPLFLLPSSIIDTLAIALPIPLITSTYGIIYAGIYALSYRVLAIPLGLISTNIADVLHSQLASYAREKPLEIVSLFLNSAKKLFFLGFFPMLSLAIISFYFSSLIFGNEWSSAGIIIAIMMPRMFAGFVISPLSRVVCVIGGQSIKFIYDIASILSVVGSIFIGSYYQLSFITTISILSFTGTIAYIIYFAIQVYIVNTYHHKLITS